MKDISKTTALVADKGLFLHVAQALARKCDRVFYWTPHERAMPVLKDNVIGEGYPNIERCESIWQVKDKVDFFVFPDIGFAAEQYELRKQEIPVWGSNYSYLFESNRGLFLEALRQRGLPVASHKVCKGINDLAEYLIKAEDKFIKISKYRGDLETTHWRSWGEDSGLIDLWRIRFGPFSNHITFYVFDRIDTTLEDGIDTYCIGGKLPKMCVHGMEAKDQAYLGTAVKFSSIDERVRRFSEEFAEVLGQYPYVNMFSTEIRLTDKEDYFIDPTLRFASPPSQVMCDMITNLPEIIYLGANGELLEPEFAAKFGVQSLVEGHGEDELWTEAIIDPSIADSFKMTQSCFVDGKHCSPPGCVYGDGKGWLVATGDTIPDALDSIKAKADKLPDGWSINMEALSDLLKEVKTAEENDMQFTDQKVPEPETVLAES